MSDLDLMDEFGYNFASVETFPDEDPSLDYLVRYLVNMGRCGRYFSIHDPKDDRIRHEVGCRRAMAAMELAAPYMVGGYRTNSDESDRYFYRPPSADVAWMFVCELVESINGGHYYGPSGGVFEAPMGAAPLLNFVQETMRERGAKLFDPHSRARKSLREAIRLCYTSLRDINLSPARIDELAPEHHAYEFDQEDY